MDWNKEARQILKGEIARKDLSYKQMVRLLAEIGVDETERAIANKISRGTFPFSFFVQCMRAMGVKSVNLED